MGDVGVGPAGGRDQRWSDIGPEAGTGGAGCAANCAGEPTTDALREWS